MPLRAKVRECARKGCERPVQGMGKYCSYACEALAVPGRRKMGNQPKTVEGKSFQSTLEADRYQELLLLQKAGDITELETQKEFRLEVNKKLICKYRADFVYFDKRGNRIVEDTKGFVTQIYTMKKRLMDAIHDITIRELRRHEVGRFK